MMKPIYLDYAAATPMAQAAIESMQPYWQTDFYNPSAAYQSARNIRNKLEGYRASVASVLGCKDQEIVFTAGGTEANNLAVTGIMSQYPKGEVLISSIEHESILEPAANFQHRLIPVSNKGIVKLDSLQKMIGDSTVFISVMYANNEVGTIQPIKEIATIIKQVRLDRVKRNLKLPIYLHTDACQAANYLGLSVARLGVDMMTLNGGKIYAAKQSGCLYVKSDIKLEALIKGGGQESGLRNGTENMGAIAAFATMLQNVQQGRKEESRRLTGLRDQLFAKLSQNIPEMTLNGDKKKRLPNNLNITIPGVDGERLLMELDEACVMVATSSACTASNDQPSHVLRAIGLNNDDASASLRISLGRNTTKDEVEKAAEIIVETTLRHKRLV